MQKLVCPNCRAALSVGDGLEEYKCDYCGTLIRIKLSKSSLDAKLTVKKYEHEERMAEKEIEREQREEDEKERVKSIRALLIIFLIILILAAMMFECASDVLSAPFTYKVPDSAYSYEGERASVVEADMLGIGFTDIEMIALEDLKSMDEASKQDEVARISINGDSSFSSNERFPKDAKVVISYHSYPDGLETEG